MIAEAVHVGHSQREAVLLYGFVLVSMSLVIGGLSPYVATHHDLPEPGATDVEVVAVAPRVAPILALGEVVLVPAIFIPQVAEFGCLVAAVVGVCRSRGDAAATT